MASQKYNDKITVYGTQKEIKDVFDTLDTGQQSIVGTEGFVRTNLQKIVDDNKLKATILYDGNSIYSKDRILRDIKKVKNSGMDKMTDYLYKFLSLQCGSIAHFNKQGWISHYPTIGHLQQFFICNESNKRVLQYLPHWYTDAHCIVKAIEKELGI